MITQWSNARTFTELACRAAMLREAADAFPAGPDRDRLLFQLSALEERLRATATLVYVEIDAAA